MQGFSSCDKTASSVYLGEVLSNELTHLDEEVAYIVHQLHELGMIHHAFAQKSFSSKGGGNADVLGVHVGGGKGGGAGYTCRLHLCCCNTFEQAI